MQSGRRVGRAEQALAARRGYACGGEDTSVEDGRLSATDGTPTGTEGTPAHAIWTPQSGQGNPSSEGEPPSKKAKRSPDEHQSLYAINLVPYPAKRCLINQEEYNNAAGNCW